uniref:Uncharacterized protein n=1 Tax=Guillardia theta TaxID=55529 RepID=A0A7S4PR31_GUITH|mmetsp:Transcript_8175/g.27448  ORF Transcript_8175/g.27448 Transcript_8175/m.27448 type:complete len:296 (+) Transcript_8175:229-1116(+)
MNGNTGDEQLQLEDKSSPRSCDGLTRSWVDDAFLPTSNVADLNFEVCYEKVKPIGNAGAALVGDKLSTGFPWITTVWLESNDISHEGVSLLAKGFERHETLTDLSLAGNPIRKEGLQLTIESFLKNPNPSIARLNVRSCQINVLPMEISELDSLKELLCEDNPIRYPPKDVAFRRIAILRQFLKAAKNDTAHEGGDPVEREREREHRSQDPTASALDVQLPDGTEAVKQEASFGSSGLNVSTSSYNPHTTFVHGSIWYSKMPTIDPVSLVRKQNEVAEQEEFRIIPNITLRYTDD